MGQVQVSPFTRKLLGKLHSSIIAAAISYVERMINDFIDYQGRTNKEFFQQYLFAGRFDC